MDKHFVIFFSPGTFVAEMSTKEIDLWDIDKAVKMSYGIKERYGATPYGFQFITKGRGISDLDSKVTKRSSMFYLGGEVLTLEDVKDRNDPSDKILISNMECNNYKRVITNANSYKFTGPFNKGDVVLAICHIPDTDFLKWLKLSLHNELARRQDRANAKKEAEGQTEMEFKETNQ